MVQSGRTQTEVAELFRVNRSTISRLVSELSGKARGRAGCHKIAVTVPHYVALPARLGKLEKKGEAGDGGRE